MRAPAIVDSAPTLPWRQAWAGAVRPWLAVQGVVGLACAITLVLNDGGFPHAGTAPQARGWFAWDAAWYRAIASDGYDDLPPSGIRFFPLLPLLARVAALGGPLAGACLVVISSAAALAYLAVVAQLAMRLHGNRAAARRTMWIAALFPGAAAIALPYTESLSGLLICVFLLGLYSDRPGVVVAAGFLSGLVRPTGFLLAIPALLRANASDHRLRDGCVALSPLLGASSFLAYCQYLTGDAFAPFSTQDDPSLRGGLIVNPIPGVLSDDGGGIGAAPTFTYMLLGILLLGVTFRRLPRELGVWSALVLALSVSSVEAHSLPRYVAGIVPFMIVIPLIHLSNRTWRITLLASTALSAVLTVGWVQAQVVP